jgi:hypothetical protein
MLKDRVFPSILVFVATAIVSGVLSATVYARGLAFTLGPVGAAVHVPAVALMVALMGLALVRVKRLSLSQAGLAFGTRDALTLTASTVLTALWLVVFVAAVGSLTGHPLARSENPVSAFALVASLASFLGSSAIQQLTTQSLAISSSPREGLSLGGTVIATAAFTLAHAQVSTAPVYLVNVTLFGLVSVRLFAATKHPSYALPLGLHAGWNWAQLALLGAPFGGGENPIAVLRWPAASPTLLGGANGFDEGALFAAALVPLFVIGRLVVAPRLQNAATGASR